MIAALSKSTENPVHRILARNYLLGVIGILNAREQKLAGAVAAQPTHHQTPQSPIPDTSFVARFLASQSSVFQPITTGLTTANQDTSPRSYTSPYFAPARQALASKTHRPPSSHPAEEV